MKILSVISFLLISLIGFSQNKVLGEFELSQFLHSKIYTETDLSIGINLPLKVGNISFFVQYEYGGNWKTTDNNMQEVSMYTLDYHLIGGGIKYRILNQSKFYSPTIHISALTEIASNYRGGYLKSRGYFPNEREYSFEPNNTVQIGGDSPNKKYTYYYVSTPFLGSVLIGNEFRVLEGLFVNLGIGMSMRATKVRYKEWYSSEPEPSPNLSKTHSFDNVNWFKTFDLNLGINYTFPFKSKKPQPE